MKIEEMIDKMKPIKEHLRTLQKSGQIRDYDVLINAATQEIGHVIVPALTLKKISVTVSLKKAF